MAKTDNTFNNMKRKFSKAKKTALSRSFLEKIAKIMAKQVKTRTRLGKGVKKSNGPSYNLSEVLRTDDYEDFRDEAAITGKMHTSTSPRKHNLTLSGRLLNAIEGNAITNGIEISVSNQRSDGRNNNKIVDGQKKLGRVFLNLSKYEFNQVKRLVRQRIQKEIKKNFK